MWERLQRHSWKNIKRWERIINKRIVDHLLVARQCQYFLQASDTPFASSEWRDELANKEIQQQILNGTYSPKYDLPNQASEFLRTWNMMTKLEMKLTQQSCLRTFNLSFARRMNKCLVVHRVAPILIINRYSNSTLTFLKRSLICLLKQFSINVVLQQWKTTVTTLIEKDTGKPAIYRMRAIHIIELM